MIQDQTQQIVIPHSDLPQLYKPENIIPIPGNNRNYDGSTMLQFFAAFAVLVVLVYVVPSKYALWLPVIVLLGYGANRTTVVTDILLSIEKYVSEFYKG